MSGGRDAAWWPVDGGLALRVRVTPKASREDIDGVEDTAEGKALKVWVRDVPEDGKANAAVERLIAKWIGVAKGTVAVTGGQKSRIKRLIVAGRAADLANRLETAVAASSRTNHET